MDILLAGRIEIPFLFCTRGLVTHIGSEKSIVIPVVVKMDQTAQRFKIPFKYRGNFDLEVEFYFAKNSTAVSALSMIRAEQHGDLESQSPIIFSTTPNVLKFPAKSDAAVFLLITAKLKNSYILAVKHQGPSASKPEMYTHVLIAKVKDTKIMFSFFIEASVIVD